MYDYLGMETIIGLSQSATDLLNSFYAVWKDIGFLPEEFDQAVWLNNQVIYLYAHIYMYKCA